MTKMTRGLVMVVVSVLCMVVLASATTSSDLARGFGDDITWVTYRDALAQAKQLNKPVFLLLHKSWCGACKRLKAEMAGSKELAAESAHFVMVNAEDEEEPHASSTYTVDGAYVPRIFFLRPDGELIREVYNEAGHANYKYYYYSADHIVAAMRRALQAVADGGAKHEL